MSHPVLGQVPLIRNPVHLDGMEPRVGDAPLLGEHTDAVLAGLHMAPARIAALRQAGAVK